MKTLNQLKPASIALWTAALCACAGQGIDPSVVDTTRSTPAPVIDMQITPTTLDAGGSITITWTTSNATSCEGNGAWSGAVALSNTVGLPIGPLSSGTYTYGVSCQGAGGTGSNNQVVTVGKVPAPAIAFATRPASLQPGNALTLIWSTTNATGCAGTGGTGSDGWATTLPTSDTGFNTGPINAAGQYQYNLTCTGPGGSQEASKVVSVSASAAPPAPIITAFAAQPTQIQPGGTTVFTWSSNGTSCAASGGSGSDGWSGSEPTDSSGTTIGPIATAGTYSYTLTCSGPGGNTASTLQLLVSSSTQALPVTVNLSVLPTQIVAGQSAALNWSTTNATSCTASGSWSGSKPLVGNSVSTATLSAAGVYTYTLTCAGSGGTSGVGSATLTVTPAPASLTGFAASPTSIQTNQTTSLSWTTTSAASCTASGGTGNGSDGWNGSVGTSSSGTSVGPIATPGVYTYSLACTGPGGASTPQSVNVTVTSATLSLAAVTGLTVTPSTTETGGSTAAVSWGSTGATSCTASGGTGGGTDGWTGSVGTSSSGTAVGPFSTAGTYTYTLTCTGPGGNSPATSVALNVITPPPAATIATFTASPATIQTGQAATLAWTSNSADSCAASGGTGSDGWNGSVASSSTGTSTGTINTAGSYTYTLTCTGPGGTGAPSSVTLNVTNPPGLGASISSFTAANNPLTTGHGTTLSWSTSNATTCTASGGLSGSDGWTGTVPTSSTGTSIGPFSSPGTYTYTLDCNGPNGDSGTNSISINVTSPPPAATVSRFSASPSTMQTG